MIEPRSRPLASSSAARPTPASCAIAHRVSPPVTVWDATAVAGGGGYGLGGRRGRDVRAARGWREPEALAGVDDARPVEPVPREHVGGGEAPARGDVADRVAGDDGHLRRCGLQGAQRRHRRRHRDSQAEARVCRGRSVRGGQSLCGGGRGGERQRHRTDQGGRGGDAMADACGCRSQECPPSFDPATVSRNGIHVNGCIET